MYTSPTIEELRATGHERIEVYCDHCRTKAHYLLKEIAARHSNITLAEIATTMPCSACQKQPRSFKRFP